MRFQKHLDTTLTRKEDVVASQRYLHRHNPPRQKTPGKTQLEI